MIFICPDDVERTPLCASVSFSLAICIWFSDVANAYYPVVHAIETSGRDILLVTAKKG